jgi:hypothetical protein
MSSCVWETVADYLHGIVSQAELVDWAEHGMMDAVRRNITLARGSARIGESAGS